MKIAIDADGTVFRVMDLICALINFKCGTNYNSKQVTSWDFWTKEGREKEFWEVYDLMDNSNIRSALRPYDADVMRVLKEINQTTKEPVDILTCNSKQAADSIRQWFEEDQTLEVNVICIGRQTSREKLELPYKFYIDDSSQMAEIIHEYPDKRMILMNAPWNQSAKENNQVIRAHHWEKVPRILRKTRAFVI